MVEIDDTDSEIEKRRPKPFRYISTLDEESDTADVNIEKLPMSVMTDEVTQSKKLRESFNDAICIGNVSAIESVVRRHELRRDKKKEDTFSEHESDMLIRIRDIQDGNGF